MRLPLGMAGWQAALLLVLAGAALWFASSSGVLMELITFVSAITAIYAVYRLFTKAKIVDEMEMDYRRKCEKAKDNYETTNCQIKKLYRYVSPTVKIEYGTIVGIREISLPSMATHLTFTIPLGTPATEGANKEIEEYKAKVEEFCKEVGTAYFIVRAYTVGKEPKENGVLIFCDQATFNLSEGVMYFHGKDLEEGVAGKVEYVVPTLDEDPMKRQVRLDNIRSWHFSGSILHGLDVVTGTYAQNMMRAAWSDPDYIKRQGLEAEYIKAAGQRVPQNPYVVTPTV